MRLYDNKKGNPIGSDSPLLLQILNEYHKNFGLFKVVCFGDIATSGNQILFPLNRRSLKDVCIVISLQSAKFKSADTWFLLLISVIVAQLRYVGFAIFMLGFDTFKTQSRSSHHSEKFALPEN